jgi:hypothetical protein
VCLQEQLQVVLAGREAERMMLGVGEMSSITLGSIGHSRQIVQKLVLASSMTEVGAIGPRTVAQPAPDGAGVIQYISDTVPSAVLQVADAEMERLLQEV